MSKIFLFGAGGAASWILQGFKREGIIVEGFLDDAVAKGAKIGSYPIFAPDDPLLSKFTRENAVVVFCVMNPNVDEAKIKLHLSKLGWKTFKTFAEYGQNEILQSGRTCGMIEGRSFVSHSKELQAARMLLCDQQSFAMFDGFLAFCQTIDDKNLPPISPTPYFPPDLPRWKEKLRMIDCGAFDGDSLRAAQNQGYRIEASISFEPDSFSFSKLANNIKSIPEALALPCGVSDKSQLFRFSTQGDTGSSISSTGDSYVQCVAMDDCIPHFAPNLIKLDIEGSEELALRGAEKLIKKYRPGLAVSVYHLPTDIWRIPLYLSEVLGPNTQFYLRRHSRTIADTVLYVFPIK